MTHTNRSLEALLGATPSLLTWDNLLGLIEAGVSESEFLDFKRDHYGNGESERRDAAKDVAALANSGGGVLLIGIAEDERGCASELTPVPISDDDLVRHRQLVASFIAPFADFRTHTVTSPEDPALGVVVIEVSASVLAPHSVAVKDALRFPRRNGASTWMLREHEVALAYRDRFAAAESRQQSLVGRETEFLRTLDPGRFWLVVTAVPDVAETVRLDRTVLELWKQKYMQKAACMPWSGMRWDRSGTSYRNVRFDSSIQESTEGRRYAAMDLFTDGSGVYATEVWTVRDSFADRREGIQPTIVGDEPLASAAIGAVRWLGLHANHLGAQGMLNLRCRVWPISESAPVVLGSDRGQFPHPFGESSSSEHVAELSVPVQDVDAEGTALVRAAAQVLHEVGQTLGIIELPQLSASGQVRIKYWGRNTTGHLRAWCDSHGIEITEDTLDEN